MNPAVTLMRSNAQSLQEHCLQLWQSEQLSTLIVTHGVKDAIVLADRLKKQLLQALLPPTPQPVLAHADARAAHAAHPSHP